MGFEKNSVPLTSMLSSKASRLKVPISGTFELSPVCNFTCKMCYVRKTKKEVEEHHRPMVTLEQWLEIARQAREQGMLFLLLTGGEPFVWPEFWELYEALIKMGFVISINTNGSLIDDVAIERLKRYPPKRLNITLYGASDETYEALCGVRGVFQKIDQTIRKLKEAGIIVKLNSSMTPSNVQDMEKIISYAKENELVLEMATYMFPPIRRDENMVGENHRFTPEEYGSSHLRRYRLQYGEERYFEMLENIKKKAIPPPGLDESCRDPLDGKIRCRAGNAAFWVTWDGYLLPCGMMPKPQIDLYQKNFSVGWKELTEVSEKLCLSGVCEKCQNRELCHTCAAIATAETGDAGGIPTYLCKTVEVFQKIAEKDLADLDKENKGKGNRE